MLPLLLRDLVEAIDEKTNGFIRVYNGTRYLVLFGPEKYDAI